MHGFDGRFNARIRTASARRFSRRAALTGGTAGLAAGALAAVGLTAAAHSQEASPPATLQADLGGVAPLPLTGPRLAELERYAATLLAEVGTPGSSVSVIQGGQVVFEHSFGVRAMGGNDPVTPDTMFMIGSVTKSMTSMMAATLVDDGRLSWETPLVDLLPGFAVVDPELTPRLTVADSFSAGTGMPRRDAEMFLTSADLTTDELLASVARLPLTTQYGEAFQYSNQMYAVGGYAAAIAAGASPANLFDGYRLAMREQILNPMGMTLSTFALGEVLATDNYAHSHASDIYGQRQDISLLSEDVFVSSVAPAGALWSSAREMARYVQTLLARGVAPGGRRVVSSENLARTLAPGLSIPHGPDENPLLADAAQTYGLGWVTGNYMGQPMIGHAGGTIGFASQVTFLPEADLGLVVLTNDTADGAMFATAVQYHLFEVLFEQPSEIDAILTPLLDRRAQEEAQLRSRLGQVDPVAVLPWLGRYANLELGEAVLRLEGEALVLDVGEFQSDLRPIQDEATQETVYAFADPPLFGLFAPITLGTGADGGPEIVAPAIDEGIYTFTSIEA